LVLLGPPGAGKGTQAQLLKDQLEVPLIGSGDLFRYHLREQTPLGRQAAEYVNQGLLVPDEITIGIILDKVLGLTSRSGFLLDGFPRTTDQAVALETALAESSRGLDRVVFINVDGPELLRRLGGRYTCRECQAPNTPSEAGRDLAESGSDQATCVNCGGQLYQRDDDRPEAVQRRLQVYQDETFPLLDFYRQRGLLTEVAGTGSVDDVNRRVLEALGQTSLLMPGFQARQTGVE
jgi:adenylate kinase